MIETLEDIGGAGLAAPQVHVPLRVVIFRVPAERTTGRPGDEPEGLSILVNPVIEKLGTGTELGWEGCLSVPGLRGAVPRSAHIRYRAQGIDGETTDREVTGFHARVAQHECDHLDGILYPMRVRDFTRFGFTDVLFPDIADAPE
jgi:peptide deformylase